MSNRTKTTIISERKEDKSYAKIIIRVYITENTPSSPSGGAVPSETPAKVVVFFFFFFFFFFFGGGGGGGGGGERKRRAQCLC